MYKKTTPHISTIKINSSAQGETIETKVERMVENKEKIAGEAPLIYTLRKHGVVESTDIRTDRWQIAQEASEKATKQKLAKREGGHLKVEKGGAENQQGESTDGKASTSNSNK